MTTKSYRVLSLTDKEYLNTSAALIYGLLSDPNVQLWEFSPNGTAKLIEKPTMTTRQRRKLAIKSAGYVYDNLGFRAWAKSWLDLTNQTVAAARKIYDKISIVSKHTDAVKSALFALKTAMTITPSVVEMNTGLAVFHAAKFNDDIDYFGILGGILAEDLERDK